MGIACGHLASVRPFGWKALLCCSSPDVVCFLAKEPARRMMRHEAGQEDAYVEQDQCKAV